MAHDHPAAPASSRLRLSDLPPAPGSADLAAGHDLAGALHEVSNALTVVVGWLERALGTALDPEQRRALTLAHVRALDGRDIARAAIGARSPSSVQQSLASLLDEALVGVQPEAVSRGVHLSLRPLAGGLLVDDARVALQILTNLLLNAVAFSPPGSTVEVSALVDQGEAVMRVADEGPGLPPERRARVFERGSTTRPGGAGLGLAHAHALALAHGGAAFLLRWPGGPARSSAETRPRSVT
ncbi:MAG: HAMP domain-containing histidine kinase, partial [Myxococcales bacterium]